jgi:DNA repair protein RadC
MSLGGEVTRILERGVDTWSHDDLERGAAGVCDSIAVAAYRDAVANALASIPAHDLPRERLLRCGVEALSERELLALVLRHGRRGESALDLAGSLLCQYGGLSAIAVARPEELAQRPGIGVAKSAALIAAFQLGRLASRSTDTVVTLSSAADVAREVSPELAGLRRERVVVLVCDGANRVRRTVVVTDGAIDRSLFPVREILNAVLQHDGRAFAVAHNHPSGDPSPSEADRCATSKLLAAARMVGLRFLDHVVIAGKQWRSVTTPWQQMPRSAPFARMQR